MKRTDIILPLFIYKNRLQVGNFCKNYNINGAPLWTESLFFGGGGDTDLGGLTKFFVHWVSLRGILDICSAVDDLLVLYDFSVPPLRIYQCEVLTILPLLEFTSVIVP